MFVKKCYNLKRNLKQKRIINEEENNKMFLENYEITIDYKKFEIIIRNENESFVIENFNKISKNLILNSGLLYDIYSKIFLKDKMILE